MIGTIVKIISKEYTILNEFEKRIQAIVMGKVRLQTTPLAGDLVEYDWIDNRYVIQKILPRRNRLYRPAVANVDQALIVMSVKDPDFSSVLVDRLRILIEHEGILPILIITKCDLEISKEIEEEILEYESGPMKTLRTQKDNLDEELSKILKGKVSVLCGQSGVGKSTILNTLEPSFHLATQEISKALGRGKHTTRHNELHTVAGGLVADTPGFSSIEFQHIEAYELPEDIMEFEPYIGRCKFNDCLHQNEPECAIKEAVKNGFIPKRRYQNYLDVLQMIQDRKKVYL